MVYVSVGERLQGRRLQSSLAARGSEAYGEEHT